jgi:hypothetical protein
MVSRDNLFSTKARYDVIVDHSRRLHMGITDGRADEFKAALFQIFAQRVGFGACRRVIFQPSDLMHNGFAVDEAPNIGVKTIEMLLDS